jgi:hypothetical protein
MEALELAVYPWHPSAIDEDKQGMMGRRRCARTGHRGASFAVAIDTELQSKMRNAIVVFISSIRVPAAILSQNYRLAAAPHGDIFGGATTRFSGESSIPKSIPAKNFRHPGASLSKLSNHPIWICPSVDKRV